jgi:molybdopterin molybdotransferase
VRPLEEARAEVLAAVKPLGTETVDLAAAAGRILAHDLVAGHDVPPFPNSAMDGYAVRAEDVHHVPVSLQVLEDLPAGRVARQEVRPGTAITIMTGAPLPGGADTIVKVEVTSQSGDLVEIRQSTPRGTSVRPAGGDFAAGTTVLEAGSTIGPAELALLATLGEARPRVGRRPVVALMATGDELRPPETVDLEPGQIRDSNRALMRQLIREAGGEVIDLGIVGDTEADLTAALTDGARRADAILSSGGVSMGEYDLIKQVLGRHGNVEFWQVAMQPAKPFAFGHIEGTPLFGLPGNPVSVMVAFEQFARPALLRMQGARHLLRPRVPAVMGEAVETDPVKTVFLRVRVVGTEDGRLVVARSGGQSSNVLSALAAADGLAIVPVGRAGVEAGEVVEVELFRHPSAGWGP